jgi:hypothetical protein
MLQLKAKHRKDMVRAKRIIADFIKDHLIPQVASKKTPKEMFDALTHSPNRFNKSHKEPHPPRRFHKFQRVQRRERDFSSYQFYHCDKMGHIA